MADEVLHRKCRACLASNAAGLCDWQEEISTYEPITYAQFFHQCTQLDVADEMPQMLCAECKSELRAAYWFVKKAIESDLTLRKVQADIGQPESVSEDKNFEFVEIKEELIPKASIDGSDNSLIFEQSCDLPPLSRPSLYADSPTEGSAANENDLDDAECKIKDPETSKQKVTCEHCSKQLLKKRLKYHIQAFHTEFAPPKRKIENGQEMCQYCKKFYSKVRIARHILVSHTKKSSTLQHCEVCSKPFTRASLYQHMLQVHPAHKWLCDVCSKTFKAKRTLERHMLSHSEKRERNYPCDLCSAKFYCKSSRDHHTRTHQKRKAEFSCEVCNKFFFTKGGLTTHKKLHTARNFVCDICQKGFSRLVDLKRHLSVHSDERPYRCSQCPKTFRKQFLYKTHLLEHQGHRWICEFCSEEFRALPHFREHRKFHLLQKLRCLICETEWTKLYRVRRHIRQVHKLTDMEEIDRHVFLPPKKVLVPRIRVADLKEVENCFGDSNKI